MSLTWDTLPQTNGAAAGSSWDTDVGTGGPATQWDFMPQEKGVANGFRGATLVVGLPHIET